MQLLVHYAGYKNSARIDRFGKDTERYFFWKPKHGKSRISVMLTTFHTKVHTPGKLDIAMAVNSIKEKEFQAHISKIFAVIYGKSVSEVLDAHEQDMQAFVAAMAAVAEGAEEEGEEEVEVEGGEGKVYTEQPQFL